VPFHVSVEANEINSDAVATYTDPISVTE